MSDVLVIGGVFREVLDADSTPRRRYGGSGLSAAVAAAQLGAATVLAGAVGAEDEEAVRALVAAAGVTDALQTVPGACGTFAFPTQHDERTPWPLYRPAEGRPREAASVPPARVILAFGIPDYDPVADGWLRDAPWTATLIWDRQGWLSRARDTSHIVRLNPSRKIYLANAREAAEEAGTANVSAALERQPPSGFSEAVIKLGTDGAVVVDRTMSDPAIARVGPFHVVVATTIGAGDVFAGAIAAGLALGKTLADAGVLGCAAAAVAIESGDNLLGGSAVARIRELTEERAALSDT